MRHILMREADFRVLSVTLNTINTPLGSSARLQDRNALYPSFGYLYPDGACDCVEKVFRFPRFVHYHITCTLCHNPSWTRRRCNSSLWARLIESCVVAS